MAARYLRSTTTGVVMPYNKQLELRPNVQALTNEEADAYEASVGKPKAAAAPEPTPELTLEPTPEPTPELPVFEDEPKVESGALDISDDEPTADAVLAALEVE